MKEELGFNIGPWNQAYQVSTILSSKITIYPYLPLSISRTFSQFDTLPVALSGPTQMRPGDLVFISGTYCNQHRKQQRHGMVHVEIWLGQGEKTVGARWQKRRYNAQQPDITRMQ